MILANKLSSGEVIWKTFGFVRFVFKSKFAKIQIKKKVWSNFKKVEENLETRVEEN